MDKAPTGAGNETQQRFHYCIDAEALNAQLGKNRTSIWLSGFSCSGPLREVNKP